MDGQLLELQALGEKETFVTRIAVSGHRVFAEVDRVITGIERALDRVEHTFGAPLILATALAEGADRLAASAVLRRSGSEIIAVLPREKMSYIQDFESESSRHEFEDLLAFARETIVMPDAESVEEGYVAAGTAVLDAADVVLAVWDGQVSQGAGGVGDVIAAARSRGMPLAWVHAGNRKPGTMEPTSLGPDQGLVTYERFPDSCLEPVQSSAS